jgi:hypothetical protein
MQPTPQSDAQKSSDQTITPEMIEAGAREYRANETDSPSERQVRNAVVEIFVAMSRAACRRPI